MSWMEPLYQHVAISTTQSVRLKKPSKPDWLELHWVSNIPPAMTRFPFICESCTLRAILRRELTWTPGDIQLLMLERMRLIDIAHAWASSTLHGTARHLGRISNFRQKYGIDLFPSDQITQPPRSASFLCCGTYWITLYKHPGRWGRGSSKTLPGDFSQKPLPIAFGRKCFNSQVTCTGIETIM
jgi:hypothetical protein